MSVSALPATVPQIESTQQLKSFAEQLGIPKKKTTSRTFLEHQCNLDVKANLRTFRDTAIIGTIGSASSNIDIMEAMMAAGMSIARIKLGYLSNEYYAEVIKKLRMTANQYGKKTGYVYPLAIAVETKGPEIYIGMLKEDQNIQLLPGMRITLTTDSNYAEEGTLKGVYVDYPCLARLLLEGDVVFLEDGLISLRVTAVRPPKVKCVVEKGGVLGSYCSVYLPGLPLDLPAVSDRDRDDLEFAVQQKVDIIIANFTRTSCGIKEIRNLIGKEGKKIKIIAKIQNQQGIENLGRILEEADGILVARGDLGVEVPLQKLFLAQKNIISRCNAKGKPVLCAAQMLQTMICNTRPTRAEVMDIANAVLDGADGVMLAAETARGSFPVECVKMVDEICREAEAAFWSKRAFEELSAVLPMDPPQSIALAAVATSFKVFAKAIVVISRTGKSARLLSTYRPPCPVLAVIRHHQVARHLRLHRGIVPVFYNDIPRVNWLKDVELRVMFGIEYAKTARIVGPGDPIILVSGWRRGAGFTNTLRVVYVAPEPTTESSSSKSSIMNAEQQKSVIKNGVEGSKQQSVIKNGEKGPKQQSMIKNPQRGSLIPSK